MAQKITTLRTAYKRWKIKSQIRGIEREIAKIESRMS
jgi:hypothetical protein